MNPLLTLLLLLFPVVHPFTVNAQPLELKLDVKRHELANGLQILTLEDHSLPVISYYTFFKVGSRNERNGMTGISHLLEHMMFNGARRYGPKAFDQVLEANGGFGNAYTTEDLTVYHESIPSNSLELVIDLESDRLAHLRITDSSLVSEREVVKEERRLRTENSVVGGVFELLHATAYTAHSYQSPVIGWMADLDKITTQQTRDYFEKHYRPDNAVVVLVGDFDTEEAVRLLRQYYGPIRSGQPSQLFDTEEPGQYGERRARLHKYAELPAVAIGYHAPAAQEPDVFALDILQMILAQGESSRLYRRLVYTDQSTLSVSATYPWMMAPALFTIYATAKAGGDTASVERAIYDEIDRLGNEPVSERELQKARNILLTAFVKDLETSSGKAKKIGTNEVIFGDWSMLLRAPEYYEAVSVDDISRVARAYFSDRNRTVITMVPEEK